MTSSPLAARTPLLAGVVALALVVVAVVINVRELAEAFLVAYTAILSVVLGMLAVALIAHLTTATWFRPFRERADAVIASLPALAVAGVVLLIAMPSLYPWLRDSSPLHGYLNAPFFIARAVLYWLTWIAVAESFRRTRRHVRQVACVGLIALGLTMTFASFDWMMSLTPDWHSTIYGVYWFAGGILSALALLAVLAALDGSRGLWPRPSAGDVHALGKLILTFVLFWIYIGFSQYIVIWSGDLPREVTWYLPRTRGGWGFVAAVLVFGNFALPFLLLLLARVKQSRAALAAIGALLLALHLLDACWLIMPGATPSRVWTVVVAIAVLYLLGMPAVWLSAHRTNVLTSLQSVRFL